MDGYALQAQDTFGFSEQNPANFIVIDRIGAGTVSNMTVKKGEAVKIATGAPLPQGTDAVVMEEYTNERRDHLEVDSSITPGENVSFQGEDIRKGDVVLKKGKLLQPQDLAIIATAGYDNVEVYRKPRVGIITTGSELVTPHSDIHGAEVINSNHYTLKALVESCLAIPTLNHSIDEAELVEKEFKKMLRNNDVLITTGGTAISKGDVVVDVASNLGEVMIHGVSIRPGKPFAYAQIDDKPVFMLSGYPVAAMVQYDVLVREHLLEMQNLKWKPPTVKKKAARKIPSTLGRTDYIRAKTNGYEVKPLKIKGSGIIRSMVESNSYIIIEENLEGIMEGEMCDVLLYNSQRV
jgi:molybdopterin molybdotransferase